MSRIGGYLVLLIMPDGTSSHIDSSVSSSAFKQLQLENEQLKTKLEWIETDYRKLEKMIASTPKKREKQTSTGDGPWLLFESQPEHEEAKLEAEKPLVAPKLKTRSS